MYPIALDGPVPAGCQAYGVRAHASIFPMPGMIADARPSGYSAPSLPFCALHEKKYLVSRWLGCSFTVHVISLQQRLLRAVFCMRKPVVPGNTG